MALSLSIRDLRFTYADGQQALRGISLDVPAGACCAVLGANGAGKSTLLLHLNGTLRGEGSIRIGDLTVTERSLPEVRSRVGLVFQDPDDQLFMPTVREDVAFGPLHQGLTRTDVAMRVEDALRVVGMEGAADRPPYHLSAGQKRRVAVATALSMACEVLVLDEPTSGLDPRGRAELGAFLATLPQTRLLATHDLELALELCSEVAVLECGCIAAQGPPAEVLADAALMERVGLEVPHSLRFHAAGIPHRHVGAGPRAGFGSRVGK